MFNGFGFDDMMDDGASWQEPDFVLSYLVSALVNLGGAPLGITLLVNGTVLTGTLVSEREYLQSLTNMLQSQIRSSLTGLSAEERKMAESAFDLTDLTEDFYPDPKEDEEPNEDEPGPGMTPINFIHLQDPVVVSPQPAIGFSEGLLPVMRIRLSMVNGWMLGTSVPGFTDIPDDGIRH